MRDFFSEQLIKKEFNEQDRSKKFRIVAITIVVSIFIWQFCATGSNTNPDLGAAFILLAVILIGCAVFFAYKKIMELNAEFEYSYTEDTFDVDIIKNRSKRKQVLSVNVAEIEIMAHIDDKEHLSMYENLPLENYGSGEILGNTYVFVAVYKGKRKRFVIEPNDAMLHAFYNDLTPRRMFRKK